MPIGLPKLLSFPASEESTSTSPIIDRALFPDIQRDDIVIGDSLGVGTFGAVFSGLWTLPDGQKRSVALKKVFVLEKEAEILSKIRHKNIIQFYGICKSEGNDFYIVTECAHNGSLYDHIHSETGTPYSFDFIIKWASQIASGIQYLHYDAVDTIIHRDLKSKNVVLGTNLVCKICDFGTSKDLTHSCTAPSWAGTAAWMSPEMILQQDGLTTATDVWSFGVVLWEILSREVPYKDYTEFRIFSLITQSGVTLAIPPSCPNQVKHLLGNCWKMTPKERMNMRQIVGELNRMSGSQKVMNECEKFLESEDWKVEIEKQKHSVEKMRLDLEKRREKLEIREKALNKRLNVEKAVTASARHPPEDVQQWSEHHTSHWVETVLGRANEQKFLDRVNAAVFRNRITGARLMEMSQVDLEHIGVNKLGARIELMRAIKRLRDSHHTARNFPTLEQANRIELSLKAEKESAALIPNDAVIVILVGMYVRKLDEHRRRFKFYVDSDWFDEYEIPMKSTSKSSSSFIKTVCFSVIDNNTNRPINDPGCSLSSGMTSTPDWMTIDTSENFTVKAIINIYYADIVTQPRNIEIIEFLTTIDESKILTERQVRLKLRRSSSTSTASPITPSYNPFGHGNGFHHATSSPQLRGFWHRKANFGRHGLTETELSSLQEHLRTPSPNRSELENVRVVPSSPGGRGRRRTITNGEEHMRETTPENRRRVVHGGKDKWNWKNKKSRPKFT